mmetsp:Transcript_16994/g.42426  ORF Transcript_16994/g.42426 Transcript_16994/m.42426 type:complete len:225 (-) Transcript_16994:95-769(-)
MRTSSRAASRRAVSLRFRPVLFSDLMKTSIFWNSFLVSSLVSLISYILKYSWMSRNIDSSIDSSPPLVKMSSPSTAHSSARSEISVLVIELPSFLMSNVEQIRSINATTFASLTPVSMLKVDFDASAPAFSSIGVIGDNKPPWYKFEFFPLGFPSDCCCLEGYITVSKKENCLVPYARQCSSQSEDQFWCANEDLVARIEASRNRYFATATSLVISSRLLSGRL